MLTVADWAASVGISRQAGYQAVKRCGIPVTGGQVDAELASYLYESRTQMRAKAPPRLTAPAASGVHSDVADALLDRANAVGRLVSTAAESSGLTEAMLDELRDAMRVVPRSHRAEVVLSAAVWDALTADVAAVIAQFDDDTTPLTDLQASEASAYEGGAWCYLAAIGVLRVAG